MSHLDFCLITPSYRRDFERCRLLVESIDKFASMPLHHYIIVDRKDLKLFKQLEARNHTIITVESILPWWIKKIPLVSNGWFSLKTLPIRNWLIQQIVKLEIANHIKEDVMVFVDSDVTMIRPFDYRDFIKEEKVKLFRESVPLSLWDVELPTAWRNSATSLLGLPSFPEYSDRNPVIDYVGNFIIWKRENVLKLHEHIEKVTQKYWIEAVANYWKFSEYMLYGIFVDCVLKEDSGHYWDSNRMSHDYWGTKPLTQAELQQFFHNIPADCFAIMISAKANMPVSDYESFIDQMYLEYQNPQQSELPFKASS